MKKFRNPASVHAPLAGYTHQIEIDPSERLLVISGQIGMKLDGTIPEEPMEQLKEAMKNLKENLAAANMEIEDLVKLNFYHVGKLPSKRRRQLVSAMLEGHEPCMTLVFVESLANPELKVELEGWATKSR